MNTRIWQHNLGDGGIACMPLKKNIPDASHMPDWKLVSCPVCGSECWESELLRQVVMEEGCTAACTECALRAARNS
ncbi:alanine racemase [Desulfosporosinus nitroreducens]|uniref:alanine racemase n=1 Tax=Desulfosporosinus nitroreducens TaxID=2018668 RepID=UPI00207C454D|nr:alanine racemase [Desulfosporosinus nitroreducens]MCO1599772.1 alanine racemase [Desulfosporosinus nitroreducens]